MDDADGAPASADSPGPRFGRCPGCAAGLGIRARLVGRVATGYDLWCWRCGGAGPVPPTRPVADALRESLLDAQVQCARHRTPLLGDRRAWPLVHHDPTLTSWSLLVASVRASADGPMLLQRYDGHAWDTLGVARSGSVAQQWLADEDADIARP